MTSTSFVPGIRITARGLDILITMTEEERDRTYLHSMIYSSMKMREKGFEHAVDLEGAWW